MEQTNTQPSLEPTKKPCLPWKIIAVVTIAALVGGLLVYFFSEYSKNEIEKQVTILQEKNYYLEQEIKKLQGDVTADWQMYTNEVYEYTIKYPSSWTVSAALGLEGIQLLPPNPDKIEYIEVGPNLFINVVDEIYSDPLVRDRQEVVVNNYTVIRQIESGIADFHSVYFSRSSGGYIKLHWAKKIIDPDPEYEQILSTFQLLNDITELEIYEDTEDWQTYANETLNFSLKYPNYYNPLSVVDPIKRNKGIYLIESETGPSHIEYESEVFSDLSLGAESLIDNQYPVFVIYVFDLDSYRFIEPHEGIEYGYDLEKEHMWTKTGRGDKLMANLPIIVSDSFVGYELSTIFDMGVAICTLSRVKQTY